MHIQRSAHLKRIWWDDPVFPTKKRYISRRQAETMSSEENLLSVPVKKGKKAASIGYFAPSNKWVPYTRIGGVDHGYLTKLYSLREIAKRYGLSQATERYWRKHVLPEPIQIVRRRSVSAHHWSMVQLICLDEILINLEQHGIQYFTKKYQDHIDLLHYGCESLEKYFAQKHEEQYFEPDYDRYGVVWEDE